MAVTISFQLSNSRGLGKIILFKGLGHELTIHPTIHGEPILTSQAFYYLNTLDSIAFLRMTTEQGILRQDQIEYLIDNYLFEYSTMNPKSRITTKVDEFVYWKNQTHNLYHYYDQANTGALIVDQGNDPTVIDIQPIDNDQVCFSDWCIPKNYTENIIEDYVGKMHSLLDEKVMLLIEPNEYRDGYMGKKRIFECENGLLDLYQAERLDHIRNIKDSDEEFVIKSTFSDVHDVYIPIERINCDRLYNPLLLSFYFSGLNDKNPLNSFVGYYNVLEYYFEEAPNVLGRPVHIEKDQLECVVELIANHNDISSFINSLESVVKAKLSQPITTSSSVSINRFKSGSLNYIKAISAWLYEIRCAVVHSKKTRKGRTTPIFEPYSEEANNIKVALPIIRWLAIQCIRKDYDLGGGKQNL
ncbi:hypothetical protein [Photobacterium damselae]|uniref:hypothetical protein n=1 Tax=Photobacterium damselae TaxID=38293 RepID=UPI0010FEC484|nr:hypothetical protein [Photobacterium damselae]NVH47419.1 hypothetical protein [Photobacterium damselae subsp. damselae]NVO62409.1 hypothetical protein [Photobacterium damselae subsp. damselae]TLS70105.1 hypothetical protein FD718_08785 [Photobacterium damselae subsp. damselae]